MDKIAQANLPINDDLNIKTVGETCYEHGIHMGVASIEIYRPVPGALEPFGRARKTAKFLSLKQYIRNPHFDQIKTYDEVQIARKKMYVEIKERSQAHAEYYWLGLSMGLASIHCAQNLLASTNPAPWKEMFQLTRDSIGFALKDMSTPNTAFLKSPPHRYDKTLQSIDQNISQAPKFDGEFSHDIWRLAYFDMLATVREKGV